MAWEERGREGSVVVDSSYFNAHFVGNSKLGNVCQCKGSLRLRLHTPASTRQGVCPDRRREIERGGVDGCPTLALAMRWLLSLLRFRTYKKVIFSFLVLVRGFLYIRRNGFIYFLYVSGGKTFSLPSSALRSASFFFSVFFLFLALSAFALLLPERR